MGWAALLLFFGFVPQTRKGVLTGSDLTLYGHRGLLNRAPENTWSAYQATVDTGLPAIELDVVQTKDGKIVCSHNFDLERETDGFGYIYNKTWPELKEINAAIHWPGKIERIPLLENVLIRLPRDYRVNIEIKTCKILDWSTAVKVAQIIKRLKIQNSTIISSFNPFTLRMVKWVNPSIKTGFLFQDMRLMKLCTFSRANYIHPRADIYNDDLTGYAKRHRLGVKVWTVNTQSGMKFFIKMCVDGIITDRPEAAPSAI